MNFDLAITDCTHAAWLDKRWAKEDFSGKYRGNNLSQSYQDKHTFVKNLVKKKNTDIRVNRPIEIAKRGELHVKGFGKCREQVIVMVMLFIVLALNCIRGGPLGPNILFFASPV